MFREIRTSEKFFEEKKEEKNYTKIRPKKELTIEQLNMEIAAIFEQAAKEARAEI